jgi:hypothetical protein
MLIKSQEKYENGLEVNSDKNKYKAMVQNQNA